MKKAAAVLAAVLLLSACVAKIEQATTAVAQERMKTNDTKARGLLIARCDMPIGAKNRILSEVERRHVEALWGGNAEVPTSFSNAADPVALLGRLKGAPQ